MTARLQVRGLRKSFAGRPVLAGVDLDLHARESLVVIGASGTGKSVLVKCLLGLLVPEGGSIRLDGQELVGADRRTWEAARARMGMLFQGGALFDSLPVWRNVTFALTAGRRIETRAMRARAIAELARVGLEPQVADLRPAELSGGMQKRVALARAIAARPEILFFDEPTTGLDPILADAIDRLILDQVRALGASALTITHDLDSVRRIADRVAMLAEGRVVWTGTVAALDAPGHSLVEQFVRARPVTRHDPSPVQRG
ncbi:MAG: ATP-binding cassette domain-containing protein [Sphingomonadaceae bacterium]|uniref:ABC transporter ATP-binding protein n=1 Tax=Thermaurantiacus sp. TaxID=2820283 RepID=UPI00298EDFA4|nr:ATP-binding cassette domain-containing protein [Thermaurantiacus sp.]MCS6987069.1 ATP-binding cassette domain-containing protein [Sphingomonadaceae bacterium]MDW8415593.1 ATP-binding cassette domain-containing protein [Thermaurantiacus sp.]